MSEVTITTLVSNYVSKLDFLGEKGLSLLIQYKDKKFLFNTGSGETILVNAVRLGVDFSSLDAVFLSHGFRGSSEGLENILSFKPKEVITHPDIFHRRFMRDNEDLLINVSSTLTEERIVESGTKLTLLTNTTEVFPDVYFSGEIPYSSEGKPQIGEQFYRYDTGDLLPDELIEEQFLLLNTKKGFVVICGATHRGLSSVIEKAISITKEKRFYLLIGIINFTDDPATIITDATMINHYFQKFAPVCCYSPKQMAGFYSVFGEKLNCLFIGETIEVY